MHDCWALTGRCAYFELNGCNKWESGCENCEFKMQYPPAHYFDRSKHDYAYKNELFNSVDKLCIVTPSVWLNNLVQRSFLNGKMSRVIYNGIDLDNFTYTKNEIRSQYNIEDKFIILCIANRWEERKGFKYILELAKKLDKDCIFMMIGNATEEQRENLPSNIIFLGPIYDKKKLMELYSTANVFINPTIDDNFPTTNIESLACGTPVITFKTGGSPEAVDEYSGIVVEQGDLQGLVRAVERCKKNPFSREECVKRSKNFHFKEKFKQYVDLYNSLLSDTDKKECNKDLSQV